MISTSITTQSIPCSPWNEATVFTVIAQTKVGLGLQTADAGTFATMADARARIKRIKKLYAAGGDRRSIQSVLHPAWNE